MSRFALDTSAYSHFKRGHAEAVELMSTATWVGVSAIVVGELRTGFALGTRATKNLAELGSFLRKPVVEALVVDEDAAAIYAEMVVALRQAGTPVPTNDLWIAAVAAREGVPVLTFDRHFKHIARVSSIVLH